MSVKLATLVDGLLRSERPQRCSGMIGSPSQSQANLLIIFTEQKFDQIVTIPASSLAAERGDCLGQVLCLVPDHGEMSRRVIGPTVLNAPRSSGSHQAYGTR
jgi:hypothetical protein